MENNFPYLLLHISRPACHRDFLRFPTVAGPEFEGYRAPSERPVWVNSSRLARIAIFSRAGVALDRPLF